MIARTSLSWEGGPAKIYMMAQSIHNTLKQCTAIVSLLPSIVRWLTSMSLDFTFGIDSAEIDLYVTT